MPEPGEFSSDLRDALVTSVREEALRHAVDVLNRLHRADPSVLPALLAFRVPCAEEVANDEEIAVRPAEGGGFETGLLGVLNGVLSLPGPPGPRVAAVFADAAGENLAGFRVVR